MLPETYELLEQRISMLCRIKTMMANNSSSSIGERFDIGKSSLNVSFMRVVKVQNEIADNVNEWPRNKKATRVKQTFQHIGGLLNILGAIDISYKGPEINAQYKLQKQEKLLCHHFTSSI